MVHSMDAVGLIPALSGDEITLPADLGLIIAHVIFMPLPLYSSCFYNSVILIIRRSLPQVKNCNLFASLSTELKF